MLVHSAAEQAAMPRIVWLLVLAVAVVGSNSLVMGPIAPAIAAELESSIGQVLYASAGYGLGTGASALLLARWIDKLGIVLMLRVAFLIFLFAFVACALAGSVWLLVAAQVMAGIAAGIALPSIYAYAAKLSPAGRESQILGTVLTGWTISMVAGVSVSALLADIIEWRAVFWILALPVVVVLLVLFRLEKVTPESELAPSPIVAFKIPGVAGLLWSVSLYMLSFYGVYSYAGDHIVNVLNKPLAANALLAASYGIGFGLAAVFGGLIDRLGSARAAPLVLAVLALAYLLLALFSGSYWFLIASSFVWGLLNHLGINVLIAQLSAIDVARRGTILGLYSAITYFCMFVATLVFGWVYPLTGWSGLALVAMFLCFLAAYAARSKTDNPLRL